MKVERRSCRQNIESTLFEWRDENRSCLKYENSLSGGNPHPRSHWHQLKTKESASVMYCVRPAGNGAPEMQTPGGEK